MAATWEILTVIEKKTCEFFQKQSITVKRLSVVRKSDRFSQGDIVIPAGCHEKLEDEVLSNLKCKLLDELKLEGNPIAKLDSDDYNSVIVYLDRPCVFKETIQTVIKENNNYGTHKQLKDRMILLCNEHLLKNSKNDSAENISLERLRSLVLHDHLVYLLQNEGYNVCSPVQRKALQKYESILSRLGIDSSNFKGVAFDSEKQKPLIINLLKSAFIEKSQPSEVTENEAPLPGDKYVDFDFNMKICIQESGSSLGKEGFDKNLSACTVFSSGSPTEVVTEAAMIYDCLQKLKPELCIYVTGERQAFSQQKVHVILHEMTMMNNAKVSQCHFVCGGVTKKGKNTDPSPVYADDLFRMRYAQLRQAAIMKYGETVHGEGWAATLEALTTACIKFEMLACVPRNNLKLDVCEDDVEGSCAGSSPGSFVMYNCARLATLFQHFMEEVERGTYPPLPSIEDIDFSTLREEAEWALLFNYVYPFPNLVEQTVENIDKSSSIHISIHTHKICQMLIGLSRCLSSYYSRYHVLGESRSQLLPTMYARLYLLKSVHQVMINGLALMGIQPLSQL